MGEKATGFHRAVTAVMFSILALVCLALAVDIWFSKPVSQYKEIQDEAIKKAQNKESECGLESDSKVYEIDCFWLNDYHCRRFIQRISRNPDLLKVFREAKKANVAILPGERFYIGDGWVSIDTFQSDEKILKFLR